MIVDNPATLVGHGDFSQGPVALCLGGIGLTAVLVARKVPGAIVVGMLGTAAVGLLVPGEGGMVTRMPEQLVAMPASPAPVFLKLSFGFLGHLDTALAALPLVLSLLLVDLFDNIGTLLAVTRRAGLLDEHGELPGAGRALVADSLATVLSALCGTSTVVSYIESAAGVEAGGRTGLASLTTAGLMVAALFLTPVILAIPPQATAPALVVVGVFMIQAVAEAKVGDFRVGFPVLLTVLAIPLCFSIAEGLGLGMIGWAAMSVATGEPRRLSPLGYGVAALFFFRFFHIWPLSG